ncbi:MAG: hypothetical protein ACYDDB_00955 [bacterium]
MKKSKLIILGILTLFVSIISSSCAVGQPMMAPAPVPSPYANYPLFEGYWQGTLVYLQNIPNITVEQLPDATNIGMLNDFNAIEPPYSSPPFYCLNGESINVWTAPNEFPGGLIVHNGLQGSQCTYGTWIITQATVQPPQPVQPQVGAGIGVAPAPTFAFAVGSGVNVYYDPFLSTYLYEYNGIYFNWVNDAWVYSLDYYGPWYAITPYVVIPTPLLFGPPPPVKAYRPYWSWWSVQIGPFYMAYHPFWWRRYGIYTANYNVYVRKVVNNYYISNNFYAVGRYRMHAVIYPHRGRLIFPQGEHPFIRRGRVIFPRGVRPVRYALPRRVGHSWLPSPVHQGHLHPHLPTAISRHPGKIVLGAHERIPSPAGAVHPSFRAPYSPPVIPMHRPPARPPLPVYTTGPIVKHPKGIYRGVGIPPVRIYHPSQKPPYSPPVQPARPVHHPPAKAKKKK